MSWPRSEMVCNTMLVIVALQHHNRYSATQQPLLCNTIPVTVTLEHHSSSHHSATLRPLLDNTRFAREQPTGRCISVHSGWHWYLATAQPLFCNNMIVILLHNQWFFCNISATSGARGRLGARNTHVTRTLDHLCINRR
jgi:hypothetical protein